MHGNHFLVVAGSTRPIRRSPAIAEWVASLGREACSGDFRVLDLRDLGLGLDDEPGMPAAGGDYLCASTRAWSERVRTAKGVVIVTPQYNWGYPAALKNAIDHLYHEWREKPVLVVTYGGHGGNRCAGQLREVLTGMHVRLTSATPGLKLSRKRIEDNDGDVDPGRDFEAHHDELTEALRELTSLASSNVDPTAG